MDAGALELSLPGLRTARRSLTVARVVLSSDIWVAALIRRAEQAGAFAMVLRKGDPRAGAVLVKVLHRRAGAARLYAEALSGDGERVWMQPRPTTDEVELDAYAERARARDPDLWVVEIDDTQGRHFLTEPVEGEPAGEPQLGAGASVFRRS